MLGCFLLSLSMLFAHYLLSFRLYLVVLDVRSGVDFGGLDRALMGSPVLCVSCVFLTDIAATLDVAFL